MGRAARGRFQEGCRRLGLIDCHRIDVKRCVYDRRPVSSVGTARSAEREVVSSNPGRTNTQGLKITEEKVLLLN